VKFVLQQHFSTFVKFVLWKKDQEHSGKPSKITEVKVSEVHDVVENQPQSSVRAVATACSIPRATPHRIMTECLSLKLYKVQFFQQLYEDSEDKG
jgi:hypothetical protein